MKVSASQPFQIIYSIYEHEYLGYLVESFVVKVDEFNKLTLQHQNISSKNAKEFASGLDEMDYELIKLTDSISQDSIVNKFSNQKIKTADFFLKFFDPEKGNKLLIQEIENYVERKKGQIFKHIHGKRLFEMGRDGEPTWKEISTSQEKASVLFHFRKNDDNTHYFPTIKHDGEKIDWQYKGAYLVCKDPAWMVLTNKLYGFQKNVDGHKLQPFLNKKFIVIPKKIEETYYRKFVAPLVANYNVYAKGFEIKTEKYDPQPVILLTPSQSTGQTMSLFETSGNGNGSKKEAKEADNILFELKFKYGRHSLKNGHSSYINVSIDKHDDQYTFYKLYRDLDKEKYFRNLLGKWGMEINQSKLSLPEPKAFSWINQHRDDLLDKGFQIEQSPSKSKKYFLGEASLSIEIEENIDWFDINAVVKFGEFEIPFKELRKKILKNDYEIELPNGEIGIIPESWINDYSELFYFIRDDDDSTKLQKHHLSLVHDLKKGDLAKVTMERKLEKLKDFDGIDNAPLPKGFNGRLRPYQKSGFNWLYFLNSYRFGGCLADDMGLGKTVQTLTLLQSQKNNGEKGASLLIMPTSLIYNWQVEAKKFTPDLKVLNYSGTHRSKDVSKFSKYDLVLTSYGITRLDYTILQDYYFNYVILDESQAIKNPQSNIAKAVSTLKSKNRLILTGTPLENSTMDLWSQMNFINPGLLGTQSFFQKEFLRPIEKDKDEVKSHKLFSMIKPFILRRNKSQVLDDLPDKIENTHYSTMTVSQEERYEETKSTYRNMILDEIEQKGIGKTQIKILKGLTELRQLANNPKMIDQEYEGDSGKTEDAYQMIINAVKEDHKILVFSQFVKHLTIFRELLNEAGIKYAYLDGSTKNRKHQVDLFQENENYKVFLISLKAGGLGLNLTRADYVFLLDPWWNPAIEAQAIDRAHRIGQKNNVMIYKFITKNTVEEKIQKLQNRKRALAQNLIHTEEGFMKSLSSEDISMILE